MASTTTEIPGKATSPWLDGDGPPERPPAEGERTADVAVIGGGIVGVTSALLLARAGLDVVLLEGGRLGQGVTGRTTAKVTSLHGLTYASMLRRHGLDTARVYADANEGGLALIGDLVDELGIDCDFRRLPNLTYTEDPARRGDVEDEVIAAQEVGLPASLTDGTELPFEIAAAVRVPDQAQFHPIRYLRAVADAAERAGAEIFERSRARRVTGGRVELETGARVDARRVIVATHLPILDRAGSFALAEPQRSSALAVAIDGDPPGGMYISAEAPTRSIRALELDGRPMLVVAGNSSRMGTGDPVEALRDLERFARERFAVSEVMHRWSSHDYVPSDGLPLVGPLPLGGEALIATGMRKWGLAMGTASARILADITLGEENAWASTFDPRRLPGVRDLPSLARHNAGAGARFISDRLRRDGHPDLAPGEGAVVDAGVGKRALYRDDAGALHTISARCTHLGCLVRWNAGDRTWDCPCHGSRFAATGEVIEGPATARLPSEAG